MILLSCTKEYDINMFEYRQYNNIMTLQSNPAEQLGCGDVNFSPGAGTGFTEYLALEQCHVCSAALLGCAAHCLSICLMLLGKQECILELL